MVSHVKVHYKLYELGECLTKLFTIEKTYWVGNMRSTNWLVILMFWCIKEAKFFIIFHPITFQLVFLGFIILSSPK